MTTRWHLMLLLVILGFAHFMAAGAAVAASCDASVSCSYGSASCSRPCGPSQICVSTCTCNSLNVGCSCTCMSVFLHPDYGDFDDPLTPLIPKTEPSVTMEWSGDMTLKQLALMINTHFHWGVELSGNGYTMVETGSYSGSTLEDLIDDIGDANGFSASWSTSTSILTLTVD